MGIPDFGSLLDYYKYSVLETASNVRMGGETQDGNTFSDLTGSE